MAILDLITPGKMGTAQIDKVDGKPYPYGTKVENGALVAGQPLEKPVTKSWLFEIVDRESHTIKESFTLLLPPQSYSIKESQRVSITKTFGNAFVDDYGPDNLQITLKGISGTSHVFPTFRTTGASTTSNLDSPQVGRSDTYGYTGRDAFYEFRKIIMRYKDKEGWEQNELRVYDLADEQSYKCVLLEFSLDRSSDQPHHYPFTISLFVYERLDNYKPELKAINISGNPITEANNLDSALDKMKKLYQNIQDVVNAINMIKARSLELRSRWNKALGATTSLLTSPLDLSKNLVEAAFALVGTVADTYRAGKYTYDRYMGASEFARQVLNTSLKLYGYQISEGWQKVQTLTIDRDAGLSPDTPSGSGTGDSNSASGASERDSTQESYTFSGLILYTVLGGDTYQSISLKLLGNVDLWMYIAYVNPSVSYESALIPGTQIFIPVKTDLSSGKRKEVYIFSEDRSRDPYGADIQIDFRGNIMFSNDDAVLLSGMYNVLQAIDLQLNTEVGSLIKQSGYGIVAQAGFAGTTMAIKYLKMAVLNTVSQDPRIQSVENMRVVLESDAVYISMDIRVAGAESTLPVNLQL